MASRPISSVFLAFSVKLTPLFRAPTTFSPLSPSLRLFSTTATPYPLYYELVRYRPVRPPHSSLRPSSQEQLDPSSSPESSSSAARGSGGEEIAEPVPAVDKSKRKYLRKRMKRMYGGTDSDDDAGARGDELVELKPEIVEFPRLHGREEELYFYDAFAYPWEKEKHYRMVYQLEKKYFPDHCLDKAFADPAAEPFPVRPVDYGEKKRKGKVGTGKKEDEDDEERDARSLVFFEELSGPAVHPNNVAGGNTVSRDVSVKKVAEFFKCLKKVPNASGPGGVSSDEGGGEPYLVSSKSELPPRWDEPHGSVILVDKPKGWFSFLFS